MTEDELARRRASWLADADGCREETLQRLRFQVEFAQSALKALMIANGGALVALFSLAGTSAGIAIGRLWPCFMSFALGLAATLLASLGAFMSQGAYYEVSLREAEMFRNMAVTGDASIPDPDPRGPPHRRGFAWETGGIAAAVAALAMFVIGCALALGSVS